MDDRERLIALILDAALRCPKCDSTNVFTEREPVTLFPDARCLECDHPFKSDA